MDWADPVATKPWTLMAGDGNKTVFYKIYDAATHAAVFDDTISLDTTKPVANAGQNTTVTKGTTVVFNGSGCADENGIVAYQWNFGDGTTGTGMTTTHNYTNAGVYTVRLTVQDVAGNRNTSSITVTVLDNAIPEFPPGLFLMIFLVLLSVFATKLRKKMRLKVYCTPR